MAASEKRVAKATTMIDEAFNFGRGRRSLVDLLANEGDLLWQMNRAR